MATDKKESGGTHFMFLQPLSRMDFIMESGEHYTVLLKPLSDLPAEVS